MRRAVSVFVAVTVLLLAGRALAAEEKKAPEGRRPAIPGMDVLERLKGAGLSEDQKAKVEELKKEYEPKFKELWQKRDSVLTDEQKKARSEAAKAARAAGKRGLDLRKEAREAMKLTDEQKAELEKVDKAARELGKEFREKVMNVLTAEQKEKLKKQWQERRRGPTEKK